MNQDRERDNVTNVPDVTMSRWLRSMVSRSRQRARAAGIGHTLADEYARVLFDRQKGLCAVTGLGFSLDVFPNVLVKHPFAPSLDRTLSSGGYDPENVRLVCIAVNFGMGEWGQELYLTFARAAVAFDRSNELPASPSRSPSAPEAPSYNDLRDVLEPSDWVARQREKIAAAEAIASTLSGEPLRQQVRRLAALRRALTLGPTGLRDAANRAARARNKIGES
jgi:hypothetical protein